MSLPDSVAVKFNTYTLFCRQLLNHLQPLKDAVRDDHRLTCDQCCQYLNEVLKQRLFQKEDPRDLQRAVERVAEMLLSDVGGLKNQNPEAVKAFHKVVEAARAACPTWSYRDDLEALHQQGRQMARYFYEESHWPVTQARLDREAQLAFLYEEGAELAFRESRNTILVRFTFDCDFERYLAYPYLFMHEYVAHIFALDHDNVLFNDGWLLYAANFFLSHRGWKLDLQPLLTREQIRAFDERLHGKLNPNPRRAYRFVWDFDNWLNDPERFHTMTCELAAFEPQEGESVFWPDKFINRLEQEFDTDRSRLRRKIEDAPDVRALFEMLPPLR